MSSDRPGWPKFGTFRDKAKIIILRYVAPHWLFISSEISEAGGGI